MKVIYYDENGQIGHYMSLPDTSPTKEHLSMMCDDNTPFYKIIDDGDEESDIIFDNDILNLEINPKNDELRVKSKVNDGRNMGIGLSKHIITF